jgi:hypothetical protein
MAESRPSQRNTAAVGSLISFLIDDVNVNTSVSEILAFAQGPSSPQTVKSCRKCFKMLSKQVSTSVRKRIIRVDGMQL